MGEGYCLMCDVGELQQLANLYVRRDQSGRRYSRVEEGVGGDTTEGERERERGRIQGVGWMRGGRRQDIGSRNTKCPIKRCTKSALGM